MEPRELRIDHQAAAIVGTTRPSRRHSHASVERGAEAHRPRTIRGALTALRTWHRRARTRRHLRALDDQLLDDVGVSRTDATREADKPFWAA